MGKNIETMTVSDLFLFIQVYPEESQRYSGELKDRMAVLCAVIGTAWDKLDGTDILDGPERWYGTRNRESMTYKLRKAARYSYP